MKIASICGAALVVCAGQAASAALYSNFGGTANPTAIGLSSGTLTRSGVAAPAGSEWSELDFGNISNGSSVHRTTAGPNFRIADDFTVPAGGWTLTSAMVYGYQTGSAVGFSVASAANVRIWSGVPDAVGSTIVFGDTSTNRLLAQTNTNLFRIFGTTAPPAASPPCRAPLAPSASSSSISAASSSGPAPTGWTTSSPRPPPAAASSIPPSPPPTAPAALSPAPPRAR